MSVLSWRGFCLLCKMTGIPYLTFFFFSLPISIHRNLQQEVLGEGQKSLGQTSDPGRANCPDENFLGISASLSQLLDFPASMATCKIQINYFQALFLWSCNQLNCWVKKIFIFYVKNIKHQFTGHPRIQ